MSYKLKLPLFFILIGTVFFMSHCSKTEVKKDVNEEQQESSGSNEESGGNTETESETSGEEAPDLELATPKQQKVEEDEWSLPDWVERSDNSGIIFYDYDSQSYPSEYDDNIPAAGYRWRDLNPEEGVYDWGLIQDDLDKPGIKGVHIRITLADTMHVPRWVFQKYPELETKAFYLQDYNDIFNDTHPGYFIPVWHEGVLQELEKFFNAFKQQGLASDPKLHHIYAPGAWTWGEYGRLEDAFYTDEGLTPDDYVDRFKRLVDCFANAFEGYEYKVVFTGQDVMAKNPSAAWRDAVGRRPTQYVAELGFGWRSGLLEAFNFMDTEMPNYGHSLSIENEKNYIVTDDDHPMIADARRITANENEEFGYGTYPTDYYSLKMSILKQLELRLRYSYTNKNAFRISPAMHHYFLLTAGKLYDDSPDAWCALREGRDEYMEWTYYPERRNFFVSNWERWVYQREVEPDGKTKRVYDIDNTQDWSVNGQSYEARSTITSEGQNYIYFNVDDKFMYGGPSYKIQIKVTYFDNFKGEWELQYQGEKDDYTPLSVVNERDGKWKTVTFDIDDDHFANGQTGENDFRLYNGGEHDLIVRFVRVVKTVDPTKR